MDFPGPVRLSGVILLKKNLLDPVVHVSACLIYLFCLAIGRHISSTSFFVLFICINWLIHRHVESYRSFRTTRRWTSKLESDGKHVRAFLATNFANDYKSARDSNHQVDTYLWINNIIDYFWPYLSHVLHHELNQFLVHSRSFARSKANFKRFLYALVRQIEANILAIEHCELGARAPFIRSLLVFEESLEDKTIVYDLDLAYEGNMNVCFVCRSCCCCNSRIGFKDMFVRLHGRLTMGPVDETSASIGALSFSLLELPVFGYKGIALVDLAQLKLVRRSINLIIRERLLYPKEIHVTMDELRQRLEQKEKEHKPPTPVEPDTSERPRPPLVSRVLAQLAVITFICSNGFLRFFCQRERP